jgi:hypothetical protein
MLTRSNRWRFTITTIIVVTLALYSSPGRAIADRFLAALRIPTPQRVNVNLPSFSGANANRQLLNVVSAVITLSATTTQDEANQPAPTPVAASRAAGIPVGLPRARTDRPTLTVVGARAVQMPVNRTQLRTMLTEAGRPGVPVPAALDGAVLTVRTPRAVQAQYGHCPAPPDTTLQGQLQGRPPVSAENADCIVLTETPPASAEVPPGLDVGQVVDIALELSGMSPDQTQAFDRTFEWKAVLGLSLPRFVRSYDSVRVAGVPGVLVTTAGRRGPTYELLWQKDGVVYALAGYGSAADAVPLAASVSEAGGAR